MARGYNPSVQASSDIPLSQEVFLRVFPLYLGKQRGYRYTGESVDFDDHGRLFDVNRGFHIHEEHVMKYICLVYVEEKLLNALPKTERQSLSDESMAYCDELQKKGQFIAASPLYPVETATTLQVRNGKSSITDGPFAETKEQLGGFYLVDVKDLNDALYVASKIPAARVGSIEVRPVKDGGCA